MASTSTVSAAAVVVGAGPAGLAAAAELKRVGFTVTVIDRAERVGSSWGKHYDRLHLHTARRLSSLPGHAIPRSLGQWVARDDFIGYLDEYAKTNELDVRLGVTATSLHREQSGIWTVAWAKNAQGGTMRARVVVIATGYNHTAYTPGWESMASFGGTIVHSGDYRNPAELGGSCPLVIGAGNSGAEIAADLAHSGVPVKLAVRTPPNIVRRSVAGIPAQYLVLSISWLPTPVRDVISGWVQAASVGSLAKYGLPKAPRGIVTQMERDDVTPTIDVGLIEALRAGSVSVVPAVDGFTPTGVRFVDGTTAEVDAVVIATGYRRGLDGLIGDLGLLREKGRPAVNAEEQSPEHPGLYFIGYSNPLAGNLRQIAIDSRKLARDAKRRRVPHAT